MLAVGRWMLGDHLVECAVTLGDQAIAQVFKLMQGGGFTMRLLFADVENGANRIDFLDFEAAHEFGDVLGLAFTRDRLVNAAHAPNFNEQICFKRYACQLGIGQRGECFRQFEDSGRIAAQLAAARAVKSVIGFIKRHRISAGSGRSRINGAAINGHRG